MRVPDSETFETRDGAKLELVNYAETKRVKALMKDLQQKGAAISEPDTQVTSMMIEKMYGGAPMTQRCGQYPHQEMRRAVH